MKTYGLPYKGSKSKIAADIIAALPPADTLVDLFAGGCAITHAALLSGKYKTVIANDVNEGMVHLFEDAWEGRLAGREREWITREDFLARKDTDAYVATVWSFGGNGQDYLYGQQREDAKHALHDAIVFNDFDRMRKEYGRTVADVAEDALNTIETLHDRRVTLQNLLKKTTGIRNEAQHLESADRVNNIASLQYRAQHLERAERTHDIAGTHTHTTLITTHGDYRDVEMPTGLTVIYCDPPYKDTGGYGIEFDFDGFRSWAAAYPHQLFVSEYSMPTDTFVSVWETVKQVTFAAQTNSLYRTEHLYTQRRFARTIPTQLPLFTEAGLSGGTLNFA